MDHDAQDIRDRLHEAISRIGLSQSEVARRAGITRDDVSRYVTGKTRPPAPKLASIAQVLGVRPSDLDPSSMVRGAARIADRNGYLVLPEADREDGRVRLQVDMHISDERLGEILRILEREKADQSD